ncbi:uncharacterized protein LOC124172764 [Ischnura elegans]|uniref:uncharacterized protein LOC124172764 n=1 Tax=Ischnura elegans TaxID=197161 RepID=UPI001ED87F53|nr:uncharacterized protein LOC124172764 [Ischnura elegans]
MPLRLNLGLRRDFVWRFTVAKVSEPLIGADFLDHFHLVPDLKTSQLIDQVTGLCTQGHRAFSRQASIRTIPGTTAYRRLLAKFPEITKPPGAPREVRHQTQHHIELTPGPPIYHRDRRLAPDRLRAAKAEFDAMLREGTARRSNSPFASPLHMVRK